MKEEEIKKVLRKLGVKASSRGYSYIAYGMPLVSGDEGYLEFITKGLYVDIAHRFNTSAACVERNIRSAVEGIWKTEDSGFLAEICGDTPAARRPSNKKFLEMMHSYFIRASGNGAKEYPDGCCAGCPCGGRREGCPYAKGMQERVERLQGENRQLKALLGREEECSG